MISIVTGTLNRKELIIGLINNTVVNCDKVELVLVDGGSTDGTINLIKKINHPNIKLVEYGERSSYPHYMNLGIKNSKYEYICQWNDDALLVNNWNDVIKEIDDNDVYLFNWKYGNINDINNSQWIMGDNHKNGWLLLNNKTDHDGTIVMNYGIYNKNVFRKIGLYNNEYRYYYADTDMSERSYYFGMKIKTLSNIKVLSIQNITKTAKHYEDDLLIFNKNNNLYKEKILPNNIEYEKNT